MAPQRRPNRPSRSGRSKSRPSLPKFVPFLRVALVLTAAALLVAPPPADLVERWYSGMFYPALQAPLTTASNLVAISVFDVLVAIFVVVGLVTWAMAVRAVRRDRSARPLLRAAVTTIVLAATVYLWFLLAWGLNYGRTPLEVRLALRDMTVTTADVRALAMQAATVVNETHVAAHAFGFPAPFSMPGPLAAAMAEVEQEQGRPRASVPGRPKRTALAWFFQAAGVDGMLAPFALEPLVNNAITGPERPFVLAHEWAHLSGHADEADANFIAWLVTTRADVASLYSGWLFIVMDAMGQLPDTDRVEVHAALGPGPLDDMAAIAARQAARIDLLQRASWKVYDGYLKAQGVDDGVRSYSRGLSLVVRYGAR